MRFSSARPKCPRGKKGGRYQKRARFLPIQRLRCRGPYTCTWCDATVRLLIESDLKSERVIAFFSLSLFVATSKSNGNLRHSHSLFFFWIFFGGLSLGESTSLNLLIKLGFPQICASKKGIGYKMACKKRRKMWKYNWWGDQLHKPLQPPTTRPTYSP